MRKRRWDKAPEPIFCDIPVIYEQTTVLFHSFFRAIRLHHQLMFKLMSERFISRPKCVPAGNCQLLALLNGS